MTMADRLIREPEAVAMTGLCRTSRWQLERRGEFPQRRVICGRTSGYLESELLAWIRERPVASGNAPAAAMRARGLL